MQVKKILIKNRSASVSSGCLVGLHRHFTNFTPFNKYTQTATLNPECDPSFDTIADDLLANVLFVRKTPKYDRLKDSDLINHPYVRDVLLKNW